MIPAFIGHGIGSYFHGPPDIFHIRKCALSEGCAQIPMSKRNIRTGNVKITDRGSLPTEIFFLSTGTNFDWLIVFFLHLLQLI